MKKFIVVMLGLVLTVLFLSTAFAEIRTDYLTVSATLVPSCTVSATPVNFGDTGGADNVHANGTVTVNCDSGTTYDIGLNEGLHPYMTFRHLANSGNTEWVTYDLCTSSTDCLQNIWGNSCTTASYTVGYCVSGTGTGSNQVYPVYGMLHSFYSVPAGTYTDTVTVELVY